MVVADIVQGIFTFILQEIGWIAFSIPSGVFVMFFLGIIFERIYGSDADFWDDFVLFWYHPLGNSLACLLINSFYEKNKFYNMLIANFAIVCLHAAHLMFNVRARYYRNKQ